MTQDYRETAQFLKQYLLRYADVYFLQYDGVVDGGLNDGLLPKKDNNDDTLKIMRAVLAKSYTGQASLRDEPDCDNFWLIGTKDCSLCDTAYRDYHIACQSYDLPKLSVLDVLDFEPTILALLAPNIPILIGHKELLVCPFGLLDIARMA